MENMTIFDAMRLITEVFTGFTTFNVTTEPEPTCETITTITMTKNSYSPSGDSFECGTLVIELYELMDFHCAHVTWKSCGKTVTTNNGDYSSARDYQTNLQWATSAAIAVLTDNN